VLIGAGARRLGQMALDLLYPMRCVGCGRTGALYCISCYASVSLISPPICPLCGQPGQQPDLCRACQGQPLQIDGIRSVAAYEGTLREAIHCFKYKYVRGLAEVLGGLLVTFWRANVFPVDVIVPVPLHRRRVRERGYNQSALLALVLGREVHLPVLIDALHRDRYTISQVRLGWQERRKNVADAFSCVDRRVVGEDILLVDDVCTTGSTLEACSIALRSGGARSVFALTLARAQFV
jgi:ComF family protein